MALFNRKDKEEIITTIEINQIVANRYQPRTTFEEESLKELSESIEQYGLIQPIVVRTASENMYEIVAGERRFRAAKMAGLETIPVIIRDLEAKDSAVLAVIENIQREDLNPIEEAKSYQRLASLLDLTQDEVAKMVGKSQSAVANKMRLLQLPEDIQNALKEKSISERHARALLKFETDAARSVMLEKIIKDNLTVAETERIIEEKLSQTKEPKDVKTKVRIKGYANDVRLAINTVKKSLKTIEKFGHKAEINENENEKYYEVIIKISKSTNDEAMNDIQLSEIDSQENINIQVPDTNNVEKLAEEKNSMLVSISEEISAEVEEKLSDESILSESENNLDNSSNEHESFTLEVNDGELINEFEEDQDQDTNEKSNSLLSNDKELDLPESLETKFSGLDISFFDNLKLEEDQTAEISADVETPINDTENELDITNTFHFVYNANYGSETHTPTVNESEELFTDVQEKLINETPILELENEVIEDDDLFKTTELNLENTYSSIYESYYNDGETVEVPSEILEAGNGFINHSEEKEKSESIYSTIYDFGTDKKEKKEEIVNWQTLLNNDTEETLDVQPANDYQKNQADRVRAMFTEVTTNNSGEEEHSDSDREELDNLLEASKQEAELNSLNSEEEAIKYGAKSSFVDKLKNINNTSNSFLFEDEDETEEESKSNDGFWNLFK